MSNYTITTNFAAKDGLPSGNPGKLVLGAQLTTEFQNIATAIASKFDGALAFAPDGSAVQPSFGFTNNAGTGVFNAAGVLGFATSALQRVTIPVAGGVVIATPTSGFPLIANQLTASSGVQAIATGFYGQFVASKAGVGSWLMGGDGTGANNNWQLAFNATVAAKVTNSGNATFSAFTTAGTVGNFNVNVAAPTTASNSFGLLVSAGTNSADKAFQINNAANSIAFAVMAGDGGLILGTPTGGNQGLGTVNAKGVFIDGVAVSTSVAATSIYAVKSALTSRATLTLSNDPDLVIAIPGAGTYQVEMYVGAYNTAGPTIGINFNLNYSGTYTALPSIMGAFNGEGNTVTQTAASIVAAATTAMSACNIGAAATGQCPILIEATLVATGAGNLGFAWAQNSSNATGTVVAAGSRMAVTKIA